MGGVPFSAHPDTHVTSLVALTFSTGFRQPGQAAPCIGALCPTRKLAASSEGTVGVRSPCAVSRDLTAVLLRGCRTHHGGHRVSLLSGDPPGSAWTDSLPRPPFPHCTPSL